MKLGDALSSLVQKHAGGDLLIDTNVLLLYLVGLYDRGYITSFKRTRQYTVEDFVLVRSLVSHFRRLVTTPQILSELSNLSLTIKGRRTEQYFRRLVDTLRPAREDYIPKDIMLSKRELTRLGFTDLSIAEAARNSRYLVLTDDFALASTMQREGTDVINLNHLRQMCW